MKNIFNFVLMLAVMRLFAGSGDAYADWDHHDHGDRGGHMHTYFHYHDHPHFGARVGIFYPNEYYPVWVGGSRYYYDDGIYYNNVDGNYVVAEPPVGAVVSAVPSDFQPMVVNGVTYYVDNGTYYLHTANGYRVVAPPAQNSYTINVPNHGGGYTAVIIKRSGHGYIGPQGEFYQQFPNVSQLRMVYGR